MKEIMSKSQGMRALAAVFALATVGTVILSVHGRAAAEPAAAEGPSRPVTAMTVIAEAFRPSVSYSGFVSGVRQADVAPKTGGYVANLLVEEGDTVRAGQTLAVLDGSELSAMRESASDSYAAAKKATEKATDYYGQLVDEAEANYRKVKDSHDDGIVGSRDLRIAQEAVESAKRARDAQVAAAEAELSQAQGGRRVADVAARNATVISPFSGIVTRRHVSVGTFAAPGMPLYTVASPDAPEVSVSVPGDVARGLSRGMNVSVAPEDGEETVGGEIASISQAVGPTTQISVVRVRFAGTEAAQSVFLGQYATVSIPTGPSREAVLVPVTAVVRQYVDTFIFVVGGDNRVEKRAVRLGEEVGDRYEVVSGLSVGERIVTGGAHGLEGDDAVSL